MWKEGGVGGLGRARGGGVACVSIITLETVWVLEGNTLTLLTQQPSRRGTLSVHRTVLSTNAVTGDVAQSETPGRPWVRFLGWRGRVLMD